MTPTQAHDISNTRLEHSRASASSLTAVPSILLPNQICRHWQVPNSNACRKNHTPRSKGFMLNFGPANLPSWFLAVPRRLLFLFPTHFPRPGHQNPTLGILCECWKASLKSRPVPGAPASSDAKNMSQICNQSLDIVQPKAFLSFVITPSFTEEPSVPRN
jgi:hypothetical protein